MKNIADSAKYRLLTNHFKPGPTYSFPRFATGRKFQHKWLHQFQPWLVYSEVAKGGFCLPCALFATANQGIEIGTLVSRPLINLSKALEILGKHKEKKYHLVALTKCDEFLRVMKGQQPSIAQRLNKSVTDTVATNRQILKSIIETLILCGRQNIPLRGHRDNLTDIERDSEHVIGHGNFWALLQFRVGLGDDVLAKHLDKAARNAAYTSADIQNQLLAVIGDHIQGQILCRVSQAVGFTIVADEVTDISNKEQLSLVLRYASIDDTVREDFIGFVECDEGITGAALATKIFSTLQGYGLDLKKLRGQAYDGAANMSGATRGAAAIIKEQYPLALYLHCASHCLNLAVVKSLAFAI